MKKKITEFKAFTLSELLVVLVIVGILIAIAIPSFLPLINKAKATEAKIQLKHLHSLQKIYFYEYASFTKDLNKLNFEQTKATNGEVDGIYDIEVVDATKSSYVARAEARDDFDGDGIFNIWEINQDGDLTEVVQD